jgi:broad specificity phosphatase PhoE
MTMYLLRHAQAGSRQTWDGDDTQRPLTSFGRHQAADMVAILGDVPLDKIYTSPYLRCVETVAPLGARRSIAIDVVEALAEGPADDAIALFENQRHLNTVFCSHGDILPDLLAYLVKTYEIDLGPRPRCQKSSLWIVDVGDGSVPQMSATYVPPAHRSQ